MSSEAQSRRKTTGQSEQAGALAPYFEALGRYRLMNAEEELARASEIAELRSKTWSAILDYPPFIPAIARFVNRQLQAEAPDLKPLRAVSRALRDRATRDNETAFAAAVAEVSKAMVYADPELQVAERVAADLQAICRGRHEGLTLEVRFPPRGSRRFAAYVDQVEALLDALKNARNRFVRANLRLVVKMAHRFNNGLLPFADLIQEGNLGLMKAVDRFDHRKGFRFSTYASWWIRHSITRATVNKGRTIRIPAHLYTSYVKLRRIRREMETKLGRRATTEELAGACEMTVPQVDRVLRTVARRAVSMDAPRIDDEERPLTEIIEDPDSDFVERRLEQSDAHELLRDLLAGLPPLEVDILRRRFGLDGDPEMTLAQVGDCHDLSRERIRQLQNRALARLRRGLEVDSPRA